jgi:MoaA/NifB/PqqE/SkfB family radical SAM enzyme
MKLFQAYLDVHSSCNYKCAYCYRKEPGAAAMPSGPMPVEAFEKIVPILKRMCWSVSLSCAGEPLLHPELGSILEIVNRELAGLDVSMVTNGYLLGEKARGIILKSVLSRVSVSIDTVNPDLYARLCGCGPGALETVLGNITAFAQAKRSGRRPWPKLFVTAIAMKSTLPHLEELARRLGHIGVDGVKVQWLVPWSKELDAEAVSYDRSTAAILRDVARILASKRVYFEYPNSPVGDKVRSALGGFGFYKNKSAYALFTLAKAVNSLRKNFCRLAGTYLNIYNDGRMYACASENGPAVSFLDNDVDEQERQISKAVEFLKKGGRYEECGECRFYRS